MAYKKGHTAWNKNKPVITNTGKTHFKKGMAPWNKGITPLEVMKERGRARVAKWKKNNPEKTKELNKISYKKMWANPEYRERKRIERKDMMKNLKNKIYENYGMICACCGETNPLFLTIDHVQNDGFKDRGKSGHRRSGTSIYRKIVKDGFPPTFQILCMNCNFGKSRNNGICPHIK